MSAVLPFQLGLFDWKPPAAQKHSPTSQAAAKEIKDNSGTLRGFVLAYLRGAGEHGATDEEMQQALNMNPSTQRPRRIELVQADPPLAKDSGTTRLTRSKRKAVVWQAITSQP